MNGNMQMLQPSLRKEIGINQITIGQSAYITCKIMESVIQDQIMSHMKKHKLFSDKHLDSWIGDLQYYNCS